MRSAEKERELLDRAVDNINRPGTRLACVVQDCWALARLRGDAEWSLYFEMQVSGVSPGHPLPFSWKGDPNLLAWQPAALFARDREGSDGQVAAHSLEALEAILVEMESALARRPKPRATWGNPIEARLQEEGARHSLHSSLAETKQFLAHVRTRVRQYIAHAETTMLHPASVALSSLSALRVFVGHGRSPIWRELTTFLTDRLHLQWEEFNRISPAGKPTVDRLNEMLDEATFAFLVLTAEDERLDGSIMARQNVVHEAGLFQGRLGFNRAIILLEEGCDEFSNIHGLGQIRFPAGSFSAAFEEVRKVLEREGLLPAKQGPP